MVEQRSAILILTGPPGSGKTTVAAAMASLWDGPAVHLHADDFWHFIRSRRVPPFLPEAHRQNIVVMNALARAADAYAAGGYFVVVDGVVGPWFLEPFRLLTPDLHYVVLRPAVEIVLARASGRGGDALADPVPIRDLHRQFSDIPAGLQKHVIDSSSQSSDDTIRAVIEAVRSWNFLLGP